MVKDKISNLIIKIKNGANAGKKSVSTPNSLFAESVLSLLQKEGFINGFSKKGSDNGVVKEIEVELAYDESGKSKVTGVERVSKLSRRVYKGADEIIPVRNGFGVFVFSTPKGVMTGKEARKQNVGGEALFKIW